MILSHPPNIKHLIPSGYVKIAIENGPVEIVDLPIKHGDFPQVCKRLPEGKWSQFFTINRFESFSTPRDETSTSKSPSHGTSTWSNCIYEMDGNGTISLHDYPLVN